VADQAHDLRLELRESRVLLASPGGRCQNQRQGGREENGSHAACKARWMRSSRARAVTGPENCLPTYLPCRSMSRVSGTPESPYGPQRSLAFERTIGYVNPNLRMKPLASSVASAVSTPRTTTPLCLKRRQICSTTGASCLHGMHHDAQKLRTTTLPRNELSSRVPGRSRRSSVKFLGSLVFPLPWAIFQTRRPRRPATAATA